jgi:methionyl-tRNA formyltransferase
MMQNLNKNRIGILLDSLKVPAWVFVSLKRIIESDHSEIVLVVLRKEKKGKSLVGRILENPNLLLWRGARKIENTFFPSDIDALDIKDASKLLENVPKLEVVPKETKFSDYFQPSDLEKIHNSNLDVLVRFGFRILRGEILHSAPAGVWSFHHGDNNHYRGGPAGAWEVIENNPITGAVLQVLTEKLDDGLVLDRMLGATDRCYVNRNRNALLWNAMGMLHRKLCELNLLGSEPFLAQTRQKNDAGEMKTRGKIYHEPGNITACGFSARQCLRIARKKTRSTLTRQQWILMFGFEKQMGMSFDNFTWLVPPKDRFWADPFIIYDGGVHHVFIEEFDYTSNKGHISHMTITRDGKWTTPTTVLQQGHHLSYPFVFFWEGSYYMIPESYTNRTIDLYHCVEFPTRWEFCKHLMKDIVALDATLLEHGGKWWMFTGMQDNPGSSLNNELHLFYADSPLSDTWTPHRCNPIVSDVRRARPGGKIFTRHGHNGSYGKIFRPAQDCSREYGWGMTINRINSINENEYSETPIQTLSPSWDKKLRCLHTLNHTQGLTIIDGRIDRLRAF